MTDRGTFLTWYGTVGAANADLAVIARREGRRWTSALYSTARSIAYGLDGLYGYPKAAETRADIEAGEDRFTPLPSYLARLVGRRNG